MLAEPKRCVKYSINPRGLEWTNDDSKIGQKLLEKMGWSKGKTLGLNENGLKEHVKVATKSDRKGIGCTQQHADNWIAHQDDFNSILSSLNTEPLQTSTDKEFSLHDKSKSSRSRLHYKKFTKGKDVSGYCKTDLDCIFGQRSKSDGGKLHETSKMKNCDTANDDDRTFGVLTTTSATDIGSYFAQKLAHKTSTVSSAAASSANSAGACSSETKDHLKKHKKKVMKTEKAKHRTKKRKLQLEEEQVEEEESQILSSRKKEKVKRHKKSSHTDFPDDTLSQLHVANGSELHTERNHRTSETAVPKKKGHKHKSRKSNKHDSR